MSKALVGRRMSITENTVRQYIDRARMKYAALGRPALSKDALRARAIEDSIITLGGGRHLHLPGQRHGLAAGRRHQCPVYRQGTGVNPGPPGVLPHDAYIASLARRRMGAAARFRDQAGQVLPDLVYRELWDRRAARWKHRSHRRRPGRAVRRDGGPAGGRLSSCLSRGAARPAD
jgi:hypothetical protein